MIGAIVAVIGFWLMLEGEHVGLGLTLVMLGGYEIAT